MNLGWLRGLKLNRSDLNAWNMLQGFFESFYVIRAQFTWSSVSSIWSLELFGKTMRTTWHLWWVSSEKSASRAHLRCKNMRYLVSSMNWPEGTPFPGKNHTKKQKEPNTKELKHHFYSESKGRMINLCWKQRTKKPYVMLIETQESEESPLRELMTWSSPSPSMSRREKASFWSCESSSTALKIFLV